MNVKDVENEEIIQVSKEDFELLHKQIRKLEDIIFEKNKLLKEANMKIFELKAVISSMHKISKI